PGSRRCDGRGADARRVAARESRLRTAAAGADLRACAAGAVAVAEASDRRSTRGLGIGRVVSRDAAAAVHESVGGERRFRPGGADDRADRAAARRCRVHGRSGAADDGACVRRDPDRHRRRGLAMAEGVVEQSVSEAPAGRIVQVLGRTLSVVAAVLAALACVALVLGAVRLALGPIRISATDPSRVALQAALVWLVAVFITPRLRARAPIALLSLALVLVTAATDSLPRRVGDGAEYLAMAINVAHGRPPALSADERRELVTRFEDTPGFS